MTNKIAGGNREQLLWLRYALLPRFPVPDVTEWGAIYDFADKQKIIGICDPTKYEVKIDIEVVSLWLGDVLQIANCNTLLNKRIVDLQHVLEQAGFRCCILKGQGNAQMYPNPLSRTPGDIDVWLDADENTIQKFVRERFPDAKECFKHIKFPIYDDVEVDVHQTPLKLRHPLHQQRLCKWISLHKEEQFSNQIKLTGTDSIIHVPTPQFNAVYQLGHIMIHLFDEGIGFRQMIDLFYVLKRLDGISSGERDEIVHTWKILGMYRLASAVMWIESDILGLPERCVLTLPNRQLGEKLLADVLEGGNFGRYSIRQSYRFGGKRFARRFLSFKRLIRLSPCFPSEVVFWIVSKCVGMIKYDVKKLMPHSDN